MKTLLIADDEFFILERLKRMLMQEQKEFELVAACNNGKQALEQIRTLKPDLAILDIRMPFLSGLEIAEQIKQDSLQTQVILLTSYDLFDFAKQAVNLHVFSYLLKPIKQAELLQVLKQAAESIDRQRVRSRNLQRYEQQVLSQTLYLFLSGSAMSASMQQQLHKLLVDTERFRLILLKTDSHAAFPDANEVVFQTLTAALGDAPLLFTPVSERTGALILRENGFTPDTPTHLHDCLARQLHGHVSLAVSAHPVESAALPKHYETLLQYLFHTIFQGADTIVYDDHPLPQTHGITFDLNRELLPHLQKKDIEASERVLRQMFERLQRAPSVRDLQVFLSQLLLLCNADEQEKQGCNTRGLFYRVQLLLTENSTIGQIEAWCIQVLQRHFDDALQESEGKLTLRVRTLIQERFAETDLNLPSIAQSLGYTANYISTVFKRETGLSVVQYITEQRMLAARQLLSARKLSVGEVCEKVGFSNPFYFSRRFKEYFGYPPSEAVRGR